MKETTFRGQPYNICKSSFLVVSFKPFESEIGKSESGHGRITFIKLPGLPEISFNLEFDWKTELSNKMYIFLLK